MNYYVIGAEDALRLFGVEKAAGWKDVKASLRKAALVSQLGLGAIGTMGGAQAMQGTPANASRTQVLLNGAGGALGGIGGALTGTISSIANADPMLTSARPHFDRGVQIGKHLVSPGARERMARTAF